MDLQHLEGKLTLFCIYLVSSGLCMILARRFLSKSISERTRMHTIVTLGHINTILLYSYKYFEVGWDFAERHYDWQEFTLITLAAAYVAHIILTFYFKCPVNKELLHHVIIIIIIVDAIYHDYVQLAAIFNFMFQLTHPQYLVRHILKDLKMDYTLLYEINENTYFVGYIVTRPILGLYMFIPFVKESGILCLIMSCILWSFLAISSIPMISSLSNNMSKISERRKKGVKYYWFSENIKVKALSFYKNKAKAI